jgi:hypothetical protein
MLVGQNEIRQLSMDFPARHTAQPSQNVTFPATCGVSDNIAHARVIYLHLSATAWAEHHFVAFYEKGPFGLVVFDPVV